MTQFINAQEIHQKHPDTFYAPSDAELASIAPGDSVKVCTGDERFWVTVTEAGESITGTVDNDLVCTDEHGLKYGDSIRFNRENIYDMMTEAA